MVPDGALVIRSVGDTMYFCSVAHRGRSETPDRVGPLAPAHTWLRFCERFLLVLVVSYPTDWRLLPERLQLGGRNRIEIEMQNIGVPDRLRKKHLRRPSDICLPDEAQAGKGKLREQIAVLIVHPANISFGREELARAEEGSYQFANPIIVAGS